MYSLDFVINENDVTTCSFLYRAGLNERVCPLSYIVGRKDYSRDPVYPFFCKTYIAFNYISQGFYHFISLQTYFFALLLLFHLNKNNNMT